MKHLFLIHSHTTFLTAMGVIEHEKILHKNVIFALSRNYKTFINHGITTYDISEMTEESFFMALSYSRRHFVYDRKKRDKVVGFFDNFVKKQIGKEYYLYCCHLQPFTCQIFATNRLCIKCFFIQEGGRAMYPLLTNKISWFYKLYNQYALRKENRFWKMDNWFPNEKTPYNKPIIAYAINNEYFNNKPFKTIIIKWPKIKIDISIHTDWPIFTLEGAVELGQIKKSVYESAVEDEIKKYSKENNYIKFHPKQTKETMSQYKKIFEKYGKKVEMLPQDIPFELIVSSFKNLTCIGFGTSLLFYAQAMGHKIISNENVLINKSLRYRKYAKGLQELNKI